MLFRSSVVLLVMWLCLPALAQAPPERRVFAVSVLDEDGRVVHGLTAENFRGEYRGQPVRILSVTEDSSPRRIAVLLDTSSGMSKRRGKWQLAGMLAEDAIIQLTPEHQIALFTFTLDLERHSGFTHDEEVLRQALLRVYKRGPLGNTAVHDALVGVARAFSPPAFGDAIYLISDAEDRASLYSAKEAELVLGQSGVRVYSFWLNVPHSFAGSSEYHQADRLRKRLGALTGGVTLQLPAWASGLEKEEKEKEIEEIVGHGRSLLMPMAEVYRLEVELPTPIKKPREWELEVVAADGKKLKEVELAYPRLLVPETKK